MKKLLVILMMLMLLSAILPVPAAAQESEWLCGGRWPMDYIWDGEAAFLFGGEGRCGARWPLDWMPKQIWDTFDAIGIGVPKSLQWLIPPEVGGRDPIIFIHGFIGGYGVSPWGLMEHRLVQDGWPSDKMYEIFFEDPYKGSIVENAEQLSTFVDKVLAETGAEKVDLIGHSMGGLSSRYYIKFLGGDKKVDDYIAIGTPQRGTIVSLLLMPIGWSTAGGMDMLPGSAFLRKLNAGDETPGNVSYTSIGCSMDELVQPSTTTKIDGATNKMTGFFCEHVHLIYKREVYEWVKEALLA